MFGIKSLDDAKAAANAAGKTAREQADRARGALAGGTSGSTDKPQPAPAVKPAETKDITPTQIEATKKVSENIRINELFTQKREKYTATKDVYINFINRELRDKPIALFLAPQNPKHSIVSVIGILDPSLTLPA